MQLLLILKSKIIIFYLAAKSEDLSGRGLSLHQLKSNSAITILWVLKSLATSDFAISNVKFPSLIELA